MTQKKTTRGQRHSEHEGTDKKGAEGIEYNRRHIQATPIIFLIFYSVLIILLAYHYSQPPKVSVTARFQEVHLSLATTTTHNPQK
jgi:hypothetical protein